MSQFLLAHMQVQQRSDSELEIISQLSMDASIRIVLWLISQNWIIPLDTLSSASLKQTERKD